MAPKASDIVKRLQADTGGKRVGLYLNARLYEDAQAICSRLGIALSNVIEAYLEEFVAEAKGADSLVPPGKPSLKRG